jgi:beta-lactamase superfamily II metal-dependent hydrolase
VPPKRKGDDLPPARPKTARLQAIDKKAEDAARALQEAADKQEQLRKERAEKLAALGKAPDGNRGDGNFHAVFLKMGQGDCTLMTTPLGHVIMLDCGSDSRESETESLYTKRIQDVIYGEKFLKTSSVIDVLILTHPDSDHYNQLKKMLDSDVQIGSYYHSANRVDYSAQQVSGFLAEKCLVACKVNHHDKDGAQVIELVTDGTQKLKLPDATSSAVPRLDGKGGILVHAERNCTISLLAGNVNTVDLDDHSNHTNRGSIATLIEVFGQRILMCGDGTINTEAYLLKYHEARLANLDVVQAGHHGSINTSSSLEFVRHVRPQQVVISAGLKIPLHHLPSWETINRYRKVMDPSPTDYAVSAWEPGAMGAYDHTTQNIFEKIYITGSRGTFEYTVEAPKAAS